LQTSVGATESSGSRNVALVGQQYTLVGLWRLLMSASNGNFSCTNDMGWKSDMLDQLVVDQHKVVKTFSMSLVRSQHKESWFELFFFPSIGLFRCGLNCSLSFS